MNEDFSEWYKKTEKECGSLITPAMAAKILNISNQHLNRIIESGRINRLKFENNTYIGMKEIEREQKRREAKKETKKIIDDEEVEQAGNIAIEAGISKKQIIEAIINETFKEAIIKYPERYKKIKTAYEKKINEIKEKNLKLTIKDIITAFKESFNYIIEKDENNLNKNLKEKFIKMQNSQIKENNEIEHKNYNKIIEN